MKAIDFRMRLLTPMGMKNWLPEPIPEFKAYMDKYNMKIPTISNSPRNTMNLAEEHGIEGGVIFGDNEYVEKIVSNNNDFFGLINLPDKHSSIQKSIEEIFRYENNEQFFGINITPFMLKMPVNDKRLYPIYAYCELNNLAVVIHSSVHYYTGSYWMEYESPKMFDEICTDFPNLKVVACHAMNPHWDMAMLLAQRHPNLYLELSSIPAKHLPKKVVKAMNSWLQDKFIWGSNFPLLPFSSVKDYQEIANEDVLFNNAMKGLQYLNNLHPELFARAMTQAVGQRDQILTFEIYCKCNCATREDSQPADLFKATNRGRFKNASERITCARQTLEGTDDSCQSDWQFFLDRIREVAPEMLN